MKMNVFFYVKVSFISRVFISMSFAPWIFLDNNCTDTDDIFRFTQSSSNNYFALIAEELPQTTVATRSKIGAKLLVEASQLALEKLQEQELDFSSHFFTLLNKAWKTKVLLHATQNPFLDNPPLSIKQLTENTILSDDVVKHYDASIGLIYLENNQLLFLQSGDAQLALLNKRNNCEIKQANQQSLSMMLNSTPLPQQLIDIEKYQLNMLVLLPHKYTTPKTKARLNSNILKIYRSFESSQQQAENNDNTQLLILRRKQKEITSAVTPQKISSSTPQKKELSKKGMGVYVLSASVLISALTASYFLWQVQATENISPLFFDTNSATNQLALNKQIEVPPSKKISLKTTDKQLEINKQTEQEKQLKAKLAETEKENNEKKQQKKKEQAAAKALKALQQKEAKQQAIAEALRIKTLEIEKARQEKELKAKIEADRKKKLAQEKALKLQQEEASLISIEKDLETINRYDKEIDRQQQLEEKKRRENQAKLAAKKQAEAEAQKKQALIQQRRREFENNKKKQQTASIKPSTPKNQEELQKQKEAEKQRIIAEELKKQQVDKVKAKAAREKVIQKTITHQLVNYSKTFYRHVVQLKQKDQAIKLLEQKKASSNDPNMIRTQEMLQSKKDDIKQRIDRLAVLYAEKLKQLCAHKVIHPIERPVKLTEVERIALAVISQKQRNCSQPQTLSSQNISKTLINRYLHVNP